jgi:hypothetical protein
MSTPVTGSSAIRSLIARRIAVRASSGDGAAPSASRRPNVSSAADRARSATDPIRSSLLRKYRYTAPADSPDALMTSAIEVLWKPSAAKSRAAATTISARRSARYCSETRGIRRP